MAEKTWRYIYRKTKIGRERMKRGKEREREREGACVRACVCAHSNRVGLNERSDMTDLIKRRNNKRKQNKTNRLERGEAMLDCENERDRMRERREREMARERGVGDSCSETA